MKFFLILPQMYPRMLSPFSRSTRNMPLGSDSVTKPSITVLLLPSLTGGLAGLLRLAPPRPPLTLWQRITGRILTTELLEPKFTWLLQRQHTVTHTQER